MFQLLKETNIDFMSKRSVLLAISLALCFVSAVIVGIKGVNPGIEFTGGTQLQLKFAARPDVGVVRDALKQAGLPNTVVTTIGDPDEHEIDIRMGAVTEDDTSRVTRILRDELGGSPLAEGRQDLNIIDERTLTNGLIGAGIGDAEAARAADAIIAYRKDEAIIGSIDEIASLEGVPSAVGDALRSSFVTGPIALRSQTYVWPAIGRELVRKALGAVLGSLVGMLIYIWIRFQIQWGFAAVVALAHDTLITLALFSLFGQEMSLPVVAAFLTLVGYSVNDTVVVFDRIRENLSKNRGGSLAETVNLSINQTLSRTIITSGLTWVVVFGLFLFGGAALRSFAFVLTVGVIVGTYSSIYVASPFLVLWTQFLEKRRSRSQAGVATT